jgi:arginine utilization regulatory protein
MDHTLYNFYFNFSDRHSLKLLYSALNVIDDGVHVINENGVTVFYSKALELMENYKAEDVIGKHISKAYKLDEESSILLRVLKTGKPVTNYRTTYYTETGTEINLITSTYPIIIDNKIIGAVSVNNDITTSKHLIDKVIDLQKQLYSNLKKNGTRYTFDDIIGISPTITNTVKLAKRIAVNLSPVLIYGETGTGKEIFAQSIHNYSLKSKGPFVAVNCAAIPATLLESALFGTIKGAFTGAEDKAGLFEEADKGTLFLDEISSMDISLQGKLLRVIESKTVRRLGGKKDIKVNPRIISALNSDPQIEIIINKLRKDLYYRLAVVYLTIPPLRERTEDISHLVQFFIQLTNKIMNKKIKTASPEVIDIFQQHDWPGNVRELQHAVEHAMNYSEDTAVSLEANHLPPHIIKKFSKLTVINSNPVLGNKRDEPLKQCLLKFEHEMIKNALDNNNGNITRAAKELGISRQNLQKRLKKFDII